MQSIARMFIGLEHREHGENGATSVWDPYLLRFAFTALLWSPCLALVMTPTSAIAPLSRKLPLGLRLPSYESEIVCRRTRMYMWTRPDAPFNTRATSFPHPLRSRPRSLGPWATSAWRMLS